MTHDINKARIRKDSWARSMTKEEIIERLKVPGTTPKLDSINAPDSFISPTGRKLFRIPAGHFVVGALSGIPNLSTRGPRRVVSLAEDIWVSPLFEESMRYGDPTYVHQNVVELNVNTYHTGGKPHYRLLTDSEYEYILSYMKTDAGKELESMWEKKDVGKREYIEDMYHSFSYGRKDTLPYAPAPHKFDPKDSSCGPRIARDHAGFRSEVYHSYITDDNRPLQYRLVWSEYPPLIPDRTHDIMANPFKDAKLMIKALPRFILLWIQWYVIMVTTAKLVGVTSALVLGPFLVIFSGMSAGYRMTPFYFRTITGRGKDIQRERAATIADLDSEYLKITDD